MIKQYRASKLMQHLIFYSIKEGRKELHGDHHRALDGDAPTVLSRNLLSNISRSVNVNIVN